MTLLLFCSQAPPTPVATRNRSSASFSKSPSDLAPSPHPVLRTTKTGSVWPKPRSRPPGGPHCPTSRGRSTSNTRPARSKCPTRCSRPSSRQGLNLPRLEGKLEILTGERTSTPAKVVVPRNPRVGAEEARSRPLEVRVRTMKTE